MDWIDPAQDRGRWRALVKVVMRGISGPSEDLSLSENGLCSMELGKSFRL